MAELDRARTPRIQRIQSHVKPCAIARVRPCASAPWILGAWLEGRSASAQPWHWARHWARQISVWPVWRCAKKLRSRLNTNPPRLPIALAISLPWSPPRPLPIRDSQLITGAMNSLPPRLRRPLFRTLLNAALLCIANEPAELGLVCREARGAQGNHLEDGMLPAQNWGTLVLPRAVPPGTRFVSNLASGCASNGKRAVY